MRPHCIRHDAMWIYSKDAHYGACGAMDMRTGGRVAAVRNYAVADSAALYKCDMHISICCVRLQKFTCVIHSICTHCCIAVCNYANTRAHRQAHNARRVNRIQRIPAAAVVEYLRLRCREYASTYQLWAISPWRRNNCA